MSDLDKILAQVRTLQAIADGGSPYPEEQARARERAERLMIRYSIDTTTVELSAEQKATPIRHEIDLDGGTYKIDKAHLYACVFRAFGCQVLRERRRAHQYAQVEVLAVVYGFTADVQMGAALAEHLLPQMLTAMITNGGPVGQRNAFAYAYATTVGARLKAFYKDVLQEAQDAGTGNAIVLASREAQVAAFMAADNPTIGRAKRRALNPGNGFTAGAAAGQRADITLADRKVTGHHLTITA